MKIKNKCIDCGKELKNKKALRCRFCFIKFNRGKNHPSWKKNKLEFKCIDCGKKLRNHKSKRCFSCYSKYSHGKNHWNWQGGNPKCIDCGKELNNRNNKRCYSCHYKYFRGRNHPLWKERPRCIDCGKELANKKAERCSICWHKYSRGKNHPLWKEKKKCIDCGKILSWGAKNKCTLCHHKFLYGENNPNFKGGPSRCINCGKKLRKHYTKPKKCFDCFHESLKGRNNPHFKERPSCVDCGKKIFNRYAKRCVSCSIKYFRGENSATWIDSRSKRKYICIDCGKETISGSPRRRCRLCYIKYSIRLCHKKNKSESFLEKLLRKCIPNEYKYVGNGKFWIEQYNPDFINVNGQKKIIEFFGDYWHKNTQKRDRKKIRLYKKYGYDCLVIWEKDLKKSKTINRILEFNKKENKHEHGIAK